ncbi:hypothetical protein G6F62_000682 [Rhizopus arrhizus]|nr:hypothetical protein G6F24_002504 [Rhizopus arrhizus]KAG1428556.1 hypothetical protein G6F58_000507 [Rhizopus delemar]KAG0794452.1 hypothetical protein G6F21_002860 [Rhizopus arrhizus]KAG0815794.1 hypothetical protein G6F20_003720 [Rhizopus arrhizus]KAG0841225.1 hypothetical protein G6F18_003316 [Rhizopus arrhizus]
MSLIIIPGEFSTFTIAIAILSGFILLFGYVSMFIKERCFLSEAFVALVVGIIAGPLVSNGFNPLSWDDHDEITKELTRCILAIQVMTVGIELPKHYMKKEWLTMFILLVPIMVFMWLVSGLFIWWLIPPLDYLHSLVIAACVCPTDPILANSVVKGRFAEKHVPCHIRNALSAESGANDGMAFPFLFLSLFLISEHNVGTAIGKWVYITCLFQITLSCIIGIVVGYVARIILQWSERNHLIDKPSFLCFAIALALFLMSMTGFSGSDDLLACFVAGNAFSWDDWFRQETEEAHFQEVIDMMLNLSVFVYIGAIIPWSDFDNTHIGLEPWRLVVIALLILLFRRLPVMLILKPVMPAMTTYWEALFSGWFGPMGVGAVFLSTIAKEDMLEIFEEPESQPVTIELISPVVLFIVLASTLVHGTTIPLFKLGDRIRTRTLSIASSSSTSQVIRLPKFTRKSGELKRNTLRNTMQSSSPVQDEEEAIETATSHLDEEDFLPEESSERRAPQTTTESQSIRFLEPVNPRHTKETKVENQKTLLTLREIFLYPHHHNKEKKLDLGIDHLNPDIEVWNEPHHVVIENKKDASSTVVIHKTEPDWIEKISRITETRWSKLYVIMALIQCVFIVILQTAICAQNTLEANQLPWVDSNNVLQSSSNNEMIPEKAAYRLGRIKWENIAFIGFQFWFFGMAVDAQTVYQNTAEILVLAVVNCLCAILGALEVVDGVKWLNLLKTTSFTYIYLETAEKIEIALSVNILAFAIIMSYLSFQMSKQFGWNIYKKIGADVRIQKFLISLFYLIQFTREAGFGEAMKQPDTWLQLIVTILILPFLYFARTAGSTESKMRMIIFIIFELLVIVHFALILKDTFQPENNWYTWIVFVLMGILINVMTIILGILCMNNFGKGLHPFVQRGAANKRKFHELELNKTNANNTWQIDD